MFGVQIINLFHMRSQSIFHTEKLGNNLFLAFKIEANIMILQPKTSFCATTCKELPIFEFRTQCDITYVPVSVSCSQL